MNLVNKKVLLWKQTYKEWIINQIKKAGSFDLAHQFIEYFSNLFNQLKIWEL